MAWCDPGTTLLTLSSLPPLTGGGARRLVCGCRRLAGIWHHWAESSAATGPAGSFIPAARPEVYADGADRTEEITPCLRIPGPSSGGTPPSRHGRPPAAATACSAIPG